MKSFFRKLILAGECLFLLPMLLIAQPTSAQDWEALGTVTRGKTELFDIVAIPRPGPQSIDTDYITALKRDDNGKLQLNLWKYTNITANALEADDEVVLGAIGDDLDLEWIPNFDDSTDFEGHRIAIAMIDGRGELRLILWFLSRESADGSFDLSVSGRLGDNVASGHRTGKIQEVSLAVLSDTRLVTAVKTNESKLKVIAWNVSADGMTLERKGSWTSAGEPELVHISRVSDTRAFVAFRNEDENLEVMSFAVNGQGEVVKESEAVRGRVNTLDHQGFRSVMRDDDNNLRLIQWQIDGAGEISYQTDNFVEGHPTGRVFDVAYEAGLSVMEDENHRLRVIEWGSNLLREGGGVAYKVKGPVKIARGFGGESREGVTAALADDDTFRITVWQEE
jgi:hypothetical protein